jgi:hypothetical protein
MSNEAFSWLPVAIAFLLVVEFLLLVVAIAREMKKRFWYLPAGMVVGGIVGAIVGGPGVWHPGTATGILVGYIVGAAASSWRRSREERRVPRLSLLSRALPGTDSAPIFLPHRHSLRAADKSTAEPKTSQPWHPGPIPQFVVDGGSILSRLSSNRLRRGEPSREPSLSRRRALDQGQSTARTHRPRRTGLSWR